MIISVRRGCFISVGGVCHTFGGVDFGASLITYMDNEVLAVIHACKNSRMDMAARAVAEDDDVAGSEFGIVHIARTRADLFNLALRGKLIERVLPSHNGLRVRSRSVDGVGNKLRIHTLNVRQIVANIVGHEACTAETVLFEPCNIRCFARYGRGIGNSFLTRKRSAVMNIRENTRCIVFQCTAVVSGLIDRAVILLLLYIVARIGKRSDNGVVEHFIGNIRGGCRKRRDWESAEHHYQCKEQG